MSYWTLIAALTVFSISVGSLRAQQSSETEPEVEPSELAVEAACRDRPSFVEAYGEEAGATEAFAYLAEGAGTISDCADAVKEAVERLSAGGVDFEADWDPFNQELQAVIDQFNQEIGAIRGRGGVLEVGQILLATIDEEMRQTRRIYANDEAGMEAALAELEADKAALEDAMKRIEQYSAEINERLLELHKRRPKIAAEMRREQISEVVTAFETLAAELAEDAEVFAGLAAAETDLGSGN